MMHRCLNSKQTFTAAFGSREQPGTSTVLAGGATALTTPPSKRTGSRPARLPASQLATEEGIEIHQLDDGTFQCPTCSRVTKRKSDHIKHQRTHSKSKPYQW